ncbi:PLP-dependent transferase [Marinilabilia salmonicolor]|uniref:PLP-dependent transferase n=1 Tax=Marinilabilia salmonicolor TaxID=989 RepID=UPI0035710BFF
MAAISTMMFTYLKPGDILLFGSPVYGGTDHFIHHVLPQFGIRILMFSSEETEDDIRHFSMPSILERFPLLFMWKPLAIQSIIS